MDRRGRGASGDAPAGTTYAIDREYEDVAAVVDAIAARDGRPVDVVGHSYGGRVALGAAPLTSNLRRLVVYESAPAAPGTLVRAARAWSRHLTALEAAGDRVGLLRTFMTEVVGMTADEFAAFQANPVWPIRVAAAHTIVRELSAEAGDGDPASTRFLASGGPGPRPATARRGEPRRVRRRAPRPSTPRCPTAGSSSCPARSTPPTTAIPTAFVAEVERVPRRGRRLTAD